MPRSPVAPDPARESFWRRFGFDPLTLASGILIVAAFPPWGNYPVIWIALVPWLRALSRKKTARAAIGEGIWLSVFMSLFGFYWVAYALNHYGPLPWPIAIVGLALYSLIGQPQFYVWAPLAAYFLRKPEPRGRRLWVYSGLALAYTGIDWLTPKLFVDTLGHAFYRSESYRQLAELGGATLLTFLVLWVALWIYDATQFKRRESLAVAGAILVLAGGYGAYRNIEVQTWMRGSTGAGALSPRSGPASATGQNSSGTAYPSAHFGLIQANIGDFDKVAAETGIAEASTKVIRTFLTMSDQALSVTPRPDFIVWPETAYPSTFHASQSPVDVARDQLLIDFARSRKISLLFGGYDHKDGKDFNGFFFLSPDHQPDLQSYQKHILLLFGEYIPLMDQIPWLMRMFPQIGNFGRGPGPMAVEVPTVRADIPSVKIGPSICYEALFAADGIGAVRKGAQVLLNITNDSWFGPRAEPELHLSLTTFRSIETRVPLLRSTNTGYSALILPDGSMIKQSALWESQVLNWDVPIYPPRQTLMLMWGDWFGWFAAAMGSVMLGLLERKRRQAERVDRN